MSEWDDFRDTRGNSVTSNYLKTSEDLVMKKQVELHMPEQLLPIPSWDEWFMRMVYEVSNKSKDKSSKIGSIIVNNNQIVKIGYNGFPRGVNDDIEERHNRPLKYKFTAHSEANAIFFAAKDGVKTDGCSMYTNGISCLECAKAIIQSGIKIVIYHKQYQDKWDKYRREQWDGHSEITKTMFDESKIKLLCYDKVLNVKSLIAGNICYL